MPTEKDTILDYYYALEGLFARDGLWAIISHFPTEKDARAFLNRMDNREISKVRLVVVKKEQLWEGLPPCR